MRRYPLIETVPGFLLAGLTPALLTGPFLLPFGLTPALRISTLLLGIGLGHAFLVGLPVYALLRLWREPGPGTITLASFLIGALTVPLLIDREALGSWWLLGCYGSASGGALILWNARLKAREAKDDKR